MPNPPPFPSQDTRWIQPFRTNSTLAVHLPGSKSISNRALLLAALSGKRLTLSNLLFSRDTEICIKALRKLGRVIHHDPSNSSLIIESSATPFPETSASLHVGNAGTVARFLTAALSSVKGGRFDLDGDPPMRARPMRGLLEVLQSAGTRFEWGGQPWHFPFTMETTGQKVKQVKVNAQASSQILSALLILAGSHPETSVIELSGETVSRPFVEMTLRMIEAFGGRAETVDQKTFHITGPLHPPFSTYSIEPDATAASYFGVLPLSTGCAVRIKDLGGVSLQGDIHFFDLLPQLGLKIDHQGPDTLVTATAESHGPKESGLKFDFNAISDTFLTLAAMAPLLNRPLFISGIEHTRHQECDRIRAMTAGLSLLGQKVLEGPDSMEIHPSLNGLLEVAEKASPVIQTFDDHRVAMSFGILGCYPALPNHRPWLQIENPDCSKKTFPNFFELLESLKDESRKSTREEPLSPEI